MDLCPQLVVLPGKKKSTAADDTATSLVEVGPRVCLQPIKIFAGSFGGPVLYENPAYVSPNKARAPCWAALHAPHPSSMAGFDKRPIQGAASCLAAMLRHSMQLRACACLSTCVGAKPCAHCRALLGVDAQVRAAVKAQCLCRCSAVCSVEALWEV